MNEANAREELVAAGRMVFERRLTFASGGNISRRLDDRTMLITPSGTCKGLLAPEQMIRGPSFTATRCRAPPWPCLVDVFGPH